MDGIALRATAHVTLTKLDEHGNIVEVLENDVDLTDEEAQAIWHSQQQE